MSGRGTCRWADWPPAAGSFPFLSLSMASVEVLCRNLWSVFGRRMVGVLDDTGRSSLVPCKAQVRSQGGQQCSGKKVSTRGRTRHNPKGTAREQDVLIHRRRRSLLPLSCFLSFFLHHDRRSPTDFHRATSDLSSTHRTCQTHRGTLLHPFLHHRRTRQS